MKKFLLITMIFAAFASALAADTYYTLFDPSYIYTTGEDGNLKWLETVPAGTSFEGEDCLDTCVPEKIGNRDNKATFVKVSYNGNPCWIIASGLAHSTAKENIEGAGVITQNAVVYTRNELGSFENIMIPQGTVVCLEKTESDPWNKFQKISFYDDQTFWKVRSAYVLGRKVSASRQDYDAVVLTKTALTKDPVKEMEIITKLLYAALDKAESEEIEEYVQSVINKMEEENAMPESVESTESAE